jgi:hypothetical protein
MNVVNALIEGVTQDVIAYLIEDNDIPINQAMDIVYNSVLFEKLSDAETGLYREGSSYVYSLLLDELKIGVFLQSEL